MSGAKRVASPPHITTRHFRHFTRGRYALGEAYRLAGVGRTGALLAPAYHCVTMLDPALALGADVQLYPLHADLSPDPEKLDELLRNYGRPVKALLATHFFGVVQDFRWLAAWCRERGIALVEDCSHALFTETFQADGCGLFGKFVTASPYKFFACADGGLLYAPEAQLLDTVETKAASLADELRGLKRLFQMARRRALPASEIDQGAESFAPHPSAGADEQIVERTRPSAQYADTAALRSSLRSSRALVRHASVEHAVTRRTDNYRRWAQAIAKLPNCHALFPELRDACVPYMFPLHIDYPDPHFYRLKAQGMPIWRWDEMAVSNCPVARDYRLHLLHLPCHQALSEAQMNWMIGALRKTLHQAAPGA